MGSRLENLRKRREGIAKKINSVLRSILCLALLFAVSPHLAFAQSGTIVRLEETAASIRYSGQWYSNGNALNSGGSAALTNALGAEATIIFDGTGITWVGFSDQWSGIALVYLDGTLTSVDTYSTNAQYQRSLYSVRGLPPGVHNLTIQVPHERGPNTQGAWVWIDRFDIENGMEVSGEVSLKTGRNEETSAAITYAGIWYSNSNNMLSGGSSLLATDPGSLGTATFTGSGITWIGYGDPWSGIAKVSVDGMPRGTVDTYRPTSQSQARLFSIEALQSGTHTLTVEATGAHNANSGGSWIWLDAFEVVDDSGGSGSSGATIDSVGLANAASGISMPVAGSIVSLYGSGFASAPVRAGTVPLPTTLGTTTVRVNGIAAPLFYVSPSQINFQVPWELSGQPQISVSVTVGAASSVPLSSTLAGFAPGIFTADGSGTGQGAAMIAGTSSLAAPEGLLAGSRPIARGEHLAIYCTGLGPVTNQPNSGGQSSFEPLASTITASPTVLIGGVPAPVEFAGLAPGFVGLYQVNVAVPPQVMVGSQVPIVLSIGGVTSNTVTVAIR